MKTWKVTLPDGDTTFVSSEDDQSPADVGYDSSCTWKPHGGPATADDTMKAAMEGNPFAAHEWARQEVNRRVEAAIAEHVPEHALAGFILDAHAEVQIFKLMREIQQKAGIALVPAGEELQKRFPNVMAVSIRTNVDPVTIAGIIETRYWPRVKKIVLSRAAQIVAHDAIANATKPEDMVTIASTANLNPGGM